MAKETRDSVPAAQSDPIFPWDAALDDLAISEDVALLPELEAELSAATASHDKITTQNYESGCSPTQIVRIR